MEIQQNKVLFKSWQRISALPDNAKCIYSGFSPDKLKGAVVTDLYKAPNGKRFKEIRTGFFPEIKSTNNIFVFNTPVEDFIKKTFISAKKFLQKDKK